jgi:hypothetical protein
MQVWSWMGTYLCLKHVHLVCASAALNGYIFLSHGVFNICILYVQVGFEWVCISRVMVSQAHAFGMCKCGLEWVHISQGMVSQTYATNLPVCNISLQVRLCACASWTREHEKASPLCVCQCPTCQDLTARVSVCLCVYVRAPLVKAWVQERLFASVSMWVRYSSRLDCKSVCLPL